MSLRATLPAMFLLLVSQVATLSADEPASNPAFEVLVVGTIHAPWQFRSHAFHPGHVRAALDIAEPDVIGVESNPAWFAEGRFHDVTYEAQRVAVPWAKARKIPVYGIDWMDVEAWHERTAATDRRRADQLAQMSEAGSIGGWAFGRVMPDRLPELEAYFASEDFDFRLVNGIGTESYGRKWLKGAGTLEPFGGRRNNQIVKRCVEVMEDHPGKRLVVVIGAGHKAVLDELFRREPRVRLLEWERDVPAPTEEAASAALTNEDRIVILGHNLDGERSYFHRELIDMDRMRSILDDLSHHGGDRRMTAYFRARWYLQKGEWKAAQALLERLASGAISGPPGKAGPYPFPLDHWRMAYDLPQAVRLELGRLHLRGDQGELSAEVLRALAAERPEPKGERDAGWRMLLLAKAFPTFLLGKGTSLPTDVAGKDAAWSAGWSAADPAHGALPIESDADSGALCVQLKHAAGAGLPHFSRRFALPAKGGSWVFAASARASGVDRLLIEAYVWPDGRRAKTVASQAIKPAGDAWQEIRLAFDVPVDQGAVLVNVYAARTTEGILWLNDARLSPAQEAPGDER